MFKNLLFSFCTTKFNVIVVNKKIFMKKREKNLKEGKFNWLKKDGYDGKWQITITDEHFEITNVPDYPAGFFIE